MIKRVFKKIYSAVPFKKNILDFIKLVFSPRYKIYKHLYFNGQFEVKLENKESFQMHHYGYEIENSIYWKNTIGGCEKVALDIWLKLGKRTNNIFAVDFNTGIYA